jgi:hypothetical protein
MSKLRTKKKSEKGKTNIDVFLDIKLPYGLKPDPKTRTTEEIYADRPKFVQFLM